MFTIKQILWVLAIKHSLLNLIFQSRVYDTENYIYYNKFNNF